MADFHKVIEVSRSGRHAQIYEVFVQHAHVTMRVFGTSRIEMLTVVLQLTTRHVNPLF
jgi:hypothetical protein